MLTPKQEKFCECIVSGMSAKDAYTTAYNTKASEQVLYNESSKLMLRDDIQARIADMRKPLIKAAQQTALSEREKIKAKLWEIINNPEANDSDRIRSCDVLNRMNAEYINIQRIEKDETPISDLDTQKLIEITKLA